jgi:hypothetical protein
MLSTLLSSLTTLRDFFSRAFFVAAFIPTLLFFSINAVVAYIWSWPFHNWISRELIDATGVRQAILFAALFFFLWVASYVVAALTPLWTRTLEGQNWWNWLREPGKKYHLARYQSLSDQINGAVQIYARIERRREGWQREIEAAKEDALRGPLSGSSPSPDTQERIMKARSLQTAQQVIPLDELTNIYDTYVKEIRAKGVTDQLRSFAQDIVSLTDYVHDIAVGQHSRLLIERNMQFGNPENIAPSAFGNVGQTAQAYAMRAFNCNLAGIWSALRHVAEKDEKTSSALENCKSQLDFLVACYWFSLLLALGWALIFTCYGDSKGAILSALLGPLICWMWWYGAAVEQYRLLQDLIVSTLNSLRFEVLTDFHCTLPTDLPEERDLWRAIDFAIGNGEPLNIRYQSPKT